jgi:transposase
MNITTYGLDLAKRVLQVHWVEPDTGKVKRKALARADVGAFFARRARGAVAMEACGSAHHWGRLLGSLGHEVRLIPTQSVRPFVKTNRTDAADAEAIWKAVQRSGMRFAALKSTEQQAVLSLHRMPSQIVESRTMQAHQVRSLIYEFVLVVPKGCRALLAQAGPLLSDTTRCPVPELVRRELLAQLEGAAHPDRLHQRPRAADRKLAAPGSGVSAACPDPGRRAAHGHECLCRHGSNVHPRRQHLHAWLNQRSPHSTQV